MSEGQAISGCPGCMAQAVLTAGLRQEMIGLQAEVVRLRGQLNMLYAQLHQTSANSHKPPTSNPSTLCPSDFLAQPEHGSLGGRGGCLSCSRSGKHRRTCG